MAVSLDDFRSGMRRLGGAVNIVTAENEGARYGLTATAVCSLSAEPPSLLACINRHGATYENLSKGRNICVNVLASEHEELAMRFASPDLENDRFGSGHWTEGQTGAPMLDEALVNFDCEIKSILDCGSHGIVIGRIVDIRVNNDPDAKPLIYIDGQFVTTVAQASDG